MGRPLARPWPPFGPARAALVRAAPFLKGGPRRPGGRAALRAALRPSGRPCRTRDVKPVAVGCAAMAASKAVPLHSAALGLGGAGLPNRRSTLLA